MNTGKYCSYKVSNKEVQLVHVESGDKVTITKEDSRFQKYLKAASQERIVNCTPSGRITICADYGNDYSSKQSVVTPSQPAKPFNVADAITTMSKVNIDLDKIKPIPTNSVLDKFLSTDGGFLPGTNIMAAGAPGVGKTTVLLEALEQAQQAGAKVLFISAEMNKMDMARYMKGFPNWSKLPILFLNEFSDECPKTVVESVINEGWDLILTDSYTEVNDTVKESCNLTRSKTEKWFLDLMIANNEGKNKAQKFTCFITILQLNKGGQFVGSNKLKHMTSAMMNIQWDGAENSGTRYMEMSKNRCGMVGQKLFYSLQNGVTLDEDRYSRELGLRDMLSNEQLKEEAFDWNSILSTDQKETEQSEI